MAEKIRNWAGNVIFATTTTLQPSTIEHAQAAIASSGRCKVVGSRHSFSTIADTDGTLISTDSLRSVVGLAPDRNGVIVEAGIRYGELATWLEDHGLALANLASLPHISVGGTVATGTHGSGNALGSLATAVTAMDLIDAKGELRHLSRATVGDDFDGMVVHLGALGFVVRLTLAVESTYQVEQAVFDSLRFRAAVDNYDEITRLGDSVSLFTTWRDDIFEQVWIKRRAGASTLPREVFGAKAASQERHPVPGMPTVNTTAQLGRPGPWHARLPHFRMEFTPSAGDELQSEYLLPREFAAAALEAIRSLSHEIAPHLFVSEIRTIAADSLWLSGAYGRPTVAVHFTWRPNAEAVLALLPRIEAALAPFHPRPHWGKLFAMDAEALAPNYPKFEAFRALRDAMDPNRKFGNAFLTRAIGP